MVAAPPRSVARAVLRVARTFSRESRIRARLQGGLKRERIHSLQFLISHTVPSATERLKTITSLGQRQNSLPWLTLNGIDTVASISHGAVRLTRKSRQSKVDVNQSNQRVGVHHVAY